MKAEEALGLAPKAWSVSSAMDDQRPNGQALLDARFFGQAMGRARGGYSMVADSRGMEFTAGKLETLLTQLAPAHRVDVLVVGFGLQ